MCYVINAQKTRSMNGLSEWFMLMPHAKGLEHRNQLSELDYFCVWSLLNICCCSNVIKHTPIERGARDGLAFCGSTRHRVSRPVQILYKMYVNLYTNKKRTIACSTKHTSSAVDLHRVQKAANHTTSLKFRVHTKIYHWLFRMCVCAPQTMLRNCAYSIFVGNQLNARHGERCYKLRTLRPLFECRYMCIIRLAFHTYTICHMHTRSS